MKKRLKNISLIAAVLSCTMLVFACSDSQKKPAATQVKTTVKHTGQASEDAGISLNTVLEPVNASVVSSVPAITAELKAIPVVVPANGYLDFDTRTFNNIASRFSGRIEKLYIKYAFQEIHRGQRILDIYSPELVTAQQDLIFLGKNSLQETGLIQAAKQKLLLLGMTDTQVDHVMRSGKAFYSLPVYSPYEGHVHDMPHSQMTEANEDRIPPDPSGNLPLPIKEGMYVEKGQTLFNVVDPHRLWAVIKIDAAFMAAVKLHQPVTLSLADNPDQTLSGQVDFIEPTLQAGDKTTSIRVYLHNMNHDLKVGSLVKAEIEIGNNTGLWIPRTALVNLGQTKIVWLKTGAAYRAHQVTTGINNGNEIQVTKGISIADSIAINAQYLSDSESFIKMKSNE